MSSTDSQRDKIRPSGIEVEDTTTFLKNASFNTRGEGSSSMQVDAVTASDLLNATAFDPSKLHPMAAIGDKLDYLLLDDEKKNQLPGSGTALPSRGWSDDLCYGTGTTYLAGQLNYFVSWPNLFVLNSIFIYVITMGITPTQALELEALGACGKVLSVLWPFQIRGYVLTAYSTR